MATTNSIDNPIKNATTTLVWRMQRGDDLAWTEAVRRTVNGCKSAKTQNALLAAIDAFEAKLDTPAAPTAKTTITLVKDRVPTGWTLTWIDDIPVLSAA